MVHQAPDVTETGISTILDVVAVEVVVAEVEDMVEDMKSGMIDGTMTVEVGVVLMEAGDETEVEVELLLGEGEVRPHARALQSGGLRLINGIVSARNVKQPNLPQLDLHLEGILQLMITNRSTIVLVKLILSQQVQAKRRSTCWRSDNQEVLLGQIVAEY